LKLLSFFYFFFFIRSTIYYEIDGGGTQIVNTNNGTSGYYEILIDCSTLGTGQKTVELSANKTLYQSQSLEYKKEEINLL